MMRQYELVERVMKYDPEANEDLLNRAHYRSLHTAVIGPHHMRVEMQIRTRVG